MVETQSNTAPPELDTAALGYRLEQLFRERRVPPRVPGSQLASLVNEALGGSWTYRDYFPAYDTPNLRKFVRQYIAPEVVSLTDQRQGSDFLYVIPQKASAVELAHEGKLWKSFVTVSPFARLVYGLKTAAVSVLSTNLPVPEDCVVVPAVSLQEHRDLCLQFCDKLATEGSKAQADALRAVVESTNGVFYQAWLKVCRANKPLGQIWGQFRHDHLLALFEQRLIQAGATAARAAQLKLELALDHEVARAPKPVGEAMVALGGASAPRDTRESREKRARDLLKSAAERLTYEQLMGIQLPLGVLLDLASSAPHEK